MAGCTSSLARPPPDISKVQDDEVGDGTTSVVVLAGELLREAEQLVNQKIHPMTIIAGFREACECAREVLAASAFSNAGDAELFRRDLMNIAKTTLSSKILTGDKEHFANLAVDAIMRLKGEWVGRSPEGQKRPGGRRHHEARGWVTRGLGGAGMGGWVGGSPDVGPGGAVRVGLGVQGWVGSRSSDC